MWMDGNYFVTERTVTIIVGSAIAFVSGEIQVNRGQNMVVREGGTMTYDVNLSEPPNDEVTVGVVRFLNDPAIGIESPTGRSVSLVFPAGSDSSVTRSVTIYGVSDNIVQANSAVVAHGIVGGSYNADDLGVQVFVSDDESTPTSGTYQFQQSFVTLSVGDTTTINVRLSSSPNTAIALRIRIFQVGNSTYDQISIPEEKEWLTFTSGNYNTYQGIEVTGVSNSDSSISGIAFIVVPFTGSTSNSNDTSLYNLTNAFLPLSVDVVD